ncbi:ComEC/Rec2 family competence protein [Oceanicola sp. D3]|uniref:ComEC/Rec2 family competence protein n=1 Tax=Oceanicola sp. D3 TaxID=2587163 RepID=UPI00111EE80D|nr:ComEC/Rec2 family competence protein [Oceanicola sp. D3]QDC09319.1 ComEC/Rec2 family competence protein [Oceanicola sp. D3]
MGRLALPFLAQRGHLLLWSPVCLGLGIGCYFSLLSEPTGGQISVAVAAAFAALILARLAGEMAGPLFLALALVLCGGALGWLRTAMVAAPVLEFRYYGPVEGRIIDIDRSQSDAVRLTLDQVRLGDMAPARLPARVRVSLHGDQRWVAPEPGLQVMLTANLSPPPGPVEPGGYDFRRQAWFDRIGAVGYTRTPVFALAPADEGHAGLALFRARVALSAAIRERLAGQPGAFAAALLTGDRSAVSQGTLDNLRASNLAHLLAISGLHMGLLTGTIFAAIRAALALLPWIALRFDTRKAAAVVALVAGAGYLGLSGGNIATERAFIMVAVMLGAVLIGRRAISLRAVALAAMIVLVRRPEALLSPGFQMSFAATTALVAVFGAVREAGGFGARWPAVLKGAAALVISSSVAGAATAPFAAAHFNRIADYGLIANLASVPVMGLWVMPWALVAGVLAPLGLSWLPLNIMGWGCAWILGVAAWVAGLEGAVTHVVGPGPWVLPLLALGALWLVLWRGGGRWLGLAGVAASLWLWTQAERPVLLVSDRGGLVGVMGPDGRALSKDRGESFTAEVWLENDGDGATQVQAAARMGAADAGVLRFEVAGLPVTHVSGRGAAAKASGLCAEGLLIVSVEPKPAAQGACDLWSPARMRRTGALAVMEDGRLVTAAEVAGRRPWSP